MSAIKERAVGFYEWFREPAAVEKASRYERAKRDVWMMGSFMVSFFAVSLLVALVGGIIGAELPGGEPAWFNEALALCSIVLTLLVDSNYVFPWGVRRFDITIPWQFREAQVDD